MRNRKSLNSLNKAKMVSSSLFRAKVSRLGVNNSSRSKNSCSNQYLNNSLKNKNNSNSSSSISLFNNNHSIRWCSSSQDTSNNHTLLKKYHSSNQKADNYNKKMWGFITGFSVLLLKILPRKINDFQSDFKIYLNFIQNLIHQSL